MAPTVPYRSSGSAGRMMARTLTTVGTRQLGRLPVLPPSQMGRFGGAGGQAPAPGPGLNRPMVPYEAAKRMGLGSLGLTSMGPPVGAGAGAGASIGASQGASIGSAIVPGIGTAIGAVIGAIGGAIAGSLGKKDPEQYNFDAAVSLWQANPNAIYSIGNKYLPLAGLFDLSLKNPHIPIYQKYGRMGEQRFVTDMMTRVYQAAHQGQITANDTPLTVMSKVVQPWIDSWGYGPMVDPHADMINRLMIGMIMDYVAGQQRNWTAVGGDYPFSSLPAFSLPAAPAIVAPAPPPITYATPVPAPNPLVGATSGNTVTVASPPIPTPVALPLPTATSPTASIAPPATATATIVTPTTTAATPGATVAPTALPPAGYNVVAADSNGNPIFANSQGVLYNWNGTSMVQFTGSLATNSTQAAQMQAAIQNALAQGYSAAQAAQVAVAQQQAAGQTIPPAIQTQVADQAVTTAAAATVAPTTAGFSLTGTTGLLAIGLAVVGLMFATARPQGRK